jgi:hypothetical protein
MECSIGAMSPVVVILGLPFRPRIKRLFGVDDASLDVRLPVWVMKLLDLVTRRSLVAAPSRLSNATHFWKRLESLEVLKLLVVWCCQLLQRFQCGK